MGRPIGSPAPNKKDPWQRILDNSVDEGDCRRWTGHANRSGYGRLTIYDRTRKHNHKLVLAHRYAYAIRHGIEYDSIYPVGSVEIAWDGSGWEGPIDDDR